MFGMNDVAKENTDIIRYLFVRSPYIIIFMINYVKG